MESPISEIARFSFSIGKKEILKGISLAIGEGEYISVVGPNGAGKPTLLKCMVRIYKGGKEISG